MEAGCSSSPLHPRLGGPLARGARPFPAHFPESEARGLQRLRLAGMKSLSERGLVPCVRM